MFPTAGCPGLALLSLPCWVLWDRHLGAQGELGDSSCVTEEEKKCLNENWDAKTYIKLLGCQQQGSACTTRNSSKFLLVARRHLLGDVSWQLQALVVPTLALKVSEEEETVLSVL